MKEFEKEKIKQFHQFSENREKKLYKKKKIKRIIIILAILFLILLILVILKIKDGGVNKNKDKYIENLNIVYQQVLKEQLKKEEDYNYEYKGSLAQNKEYEYEKLFSYVEKNLNTNIDNTFYLLNAKDLLEMGVEKSDSDYLVSYEKKVVFSTKPYLDLEKEIYTTEEIIQAYYDNEKVDLSGANEPLLFEGMQPIYYNYENENWKIVGNQENITWFNYEQKKWANVMLEDYSKDNLDEMDGSYFVWIPRFAYKMGEDNYHSSKEGNFEIKFLKGNTNIAVDGTIIDEKNTDATKDFVIHPAFNFGESLTGIWVSKFEASNNEGKYKSLHDTYSWVNITLSDAFDVSKHMKENTIYGLNADEVDTHLIKNTEWGAIAYLAQSKYGKDNKEIWINVYEDNNGVKTGYSGRKASEVNYGTDIAYIWNSYNGVEASTTGNVYGVYDLSGGAIEKVAAYIDNGSKYLLIDGKSLYEEKDNKYYDKYYIDGQDDSINNYNNAKLLYGDAIYETSSLSGGDYSWYSDTASMPSGERCFFLRGGKISDSTSAGIFSFWGSSGGKYDYSSFRAVITENTN